MPTHKESESPDAAAALRRLPDLLPGQCAVIASVETPDDMTPLMAMGVCAGRLVELVQAGDPLILRVLGTRIGVSARLARRVWVRACPAAETPEATP